MVSLLLALTSPAAAHDEQPQPTEQATCPQCLYEELTVDWAETHEKHRDANWDLFGAAGMVWLPGGPAPWAMVGVDGLRGIYAHLEGRAHPDAKWMGRVSGGFDFLAREEMVDVTLGIYAGNAAVWNTIDTRTTQVGTELGVALHLDRTHARVRFLGGPNSQTGQLRRETVWSLGYRLLKPIEIQGQAVVLNPGTADGRKQTGLGLAAALVF